MSTRTRVYLTVAVAALAAAAGAVGITLATRSDPAPAGVKQPGAPPLALDFGVRADAEARALARAVDLYDAGKRDAAAAVFTRYDSLEAQVGAALSSWPDGSLVRLQSLVRDNPRSALAQLYLGLAQFWDGRGAEAAVSFRAAKRVQPDTFYAVRADGLLHPQFAPLLPPFTPSFEPPAAIAHLSAARQVEALRRAAAGSPRSRLLYGSVLQRLGHPLSAERQFRLAAAEAPADPETLTAAAVGRFDKSNPSRAFSQLGPLSRRFPHAQTVRYHLGLMLVWMSQVKAAKRQFAAVVAEGSDTQLGREARRFLIRLQNVGTK
jgi:predicted Zn-dependent protease